MGVLLADEGVLTGEHVIILIGLDDIEREVSDEFRDEDREEPRERCFDTSSSSSSALSDGGLFSGNGSWTPSSEELLESSCLRAVFSFS